MEIRSHKSDRKDFVPNIVPPLSLFDVIEFPLHTFTSWHFGILAMEWKLIPNLTLSTLPAFCCVFVPSVSTVHRPSLCLPTVWPVWAEQMPDVVKLIHSYKYTLWSSVFTLKHTQAHKDTDSHTQSHTCTWLSRPDATCCQAHTLLLLFHTNTH